MADKRKHIRLFHEDAIEFIAEGQSLAGRSVDISRAGMKIVVNMPVSYREIRNITFTLPSGRDALSIPCRLVRIDSRDGATDEHVLGVEFAYETEAQMVLIEKFIEDTRRTQALGEYALGEMREIPRARCAILDVRISAPQGSTVSIDNISTEGFLVSHSGELEAGDTVGFEFSLPGDQRTISLTGMIMYVIQSSFGEAWSAGVAFEEAGELDRTRISNFVVSSSSREALKSVHHHLSAEGLDEERRISEPAKLSALMSDVTAAKVLVNVLFEDTLRISAVHIDEYSPQKGFRAALSQELRDLHLEPPVPAYFSFFLNGGCYYFCSTLRELQSEDEGVDQWLCFSPPDALYRSERRSYQRKEHEEDISVSLDYGGSEGHLRGRVIDISRRGFLCEIPLEELGSKPPESGQRIKYRVNEKLGLDSHGEVRHLKYVSNGEGKKILQIGIEAGIDRMEYHFTRYDAWSRRQARIMVERVSVADPRHVTILNTKSQEIVAVLNATRFHCDAPVVILPPAFGKKKETLAPLVLALLQNFAHENQDLETIRYDGINRPGESYNQEKNPKRGFEMLHYRVSQGLEDIRTVLDFVRDNPHFSATKVVLITSSMSAVDARRLLSLDGGGDVDLWISVMGVPAAQSALTTILGGIDIVGNYRMGVPNGMGGMLGHVVDLDQIAQDLVHSKYAYLSDARLDMSRIDIPVLWICGRHDRWVDAEEVRDIMSVRADGQRTVVEIPTGHSLRTSEDAMESFKLITKHVYHALTGEDIDPWDPPREEVLRIIAGERERLTAPQRIDLESYWRDYLIGTSRHSFGYDVYANIEDFREFLTRESELIDPTDGMYLADMGCGTGLFLENLLCYIQEHRPQLKRCRILAADLIDEALRKTEQKCDGLMAGQERFREFDIQYRCMDLEPNRLIPVYQFVINPALGYDYLRGRVEGLSDSLIDRLHAVASPEVADMMHGGSMTPRQREELCEAYGRTAAGQLIEFNRAARFTRRRIEPEDLIQSRRNDPVDYDRLRATDLEFEHLYFGDNGLDPQPALPDGTLDRIVASLFISYVFDPILMMHEFFRLLRPGGVLLVSSMKPDSDISGMFTSYVKKLQETPETEDADASRDSGLSGARAMLNEAAALFELEEDGYFRFYSPAELIELFESAGFIVKHVERAMGSPPQAAIVTGRKQ